MQKLTIQEVACLLQEITAEADERFQLLVKDERKGVQKQIRNGASKKSMRKKKENNL